MTGVVVYVSDLARQAAFYGAVLGLAQVMTEPGVVVLGRDDLEVTLVRAPDGLADPTVVAGQVVQRVDTPIKLAVAVPAIEAVRQVAHELGGGLRPAADGFEHRGWHHLDGHDPEGNVLQLRERVQPAT